MVLYTVKQKVASLIHVLGMHISYLLYTLQRAVSTSLWSARLVDVYVLAWLQSQSTQNALRTENVAMK